MNPNASFTGSDSPYLGHIGWRYYNSIKKKAMEQEFSWSGLVISLSIAFFIVIVSSLALNILRNSMINAGIGQDNGQEMIYRLENLNHYSINDYLQVDLIGQAKLESLDMPCLV